MNYIKHILVTTALSLAASIVQAKTIEIPANRGGYLTSELDGSQPKFISPVDTQINFIGALGEQGARQVIIGFDLPVLTGKFKSAIVEFRMRSKDAASSYPWFNIDAYAFTHDPSGGDFYIGSDDPSKLRVSDDLLTNQIADGALVKIDLTSFLKTIYNSKKPSVDTVYIRLNPDDPDGNLSTGDYREGNFARYRPILVSSDNASESLLRITIQ